MRIQILATKNAPDMVGRIISTNGIKENPDGTSYMECLTDGEPNGMVVADPGWALLEAEKNTQIACVGGNAVYSAKPQTGMLLWGSNPKNLVVITALKFI